MSAGAYLFLVIFVAAAVRPSFCKNTLGFNVLLGVCAA